jgi:cell wall-associated NlpC family hydrolase
MKFNTKAKNLAIIFFLSLSLVVGMGLYWSPTAAAATGSTSLNSSIGKPVINSFRTNFNGSLAQTVVGRAIWYMEYGYMVYGHHKYPTTGYIDCSNFVSLVYKDFGYNVTSTARNYDQVGVKVSGVYVKNGTLIGASKLKPGDIFTFQRTNYISHVAIYIGTFKGQPCFIGTTKGYPTAIGIVSGFHNWYGTQFHSVRRVLSSSTYTASSKISCRGPVIPAKYQIEPTKPIILPKNLKTGF